MNQVNIDHLRKDIEENQKRKFTRFIEIPDEDRLVVLSEGKRKELENILDEYHSKTGTKKRELQLADENINDIIDNKDAVAVRKTAFGTTSAAEVNINQKKKWLIFFFFFLVSFTAETTSAGCSFKPYRKQHQPL